VVWMKTSTCWTFIFIFIHTKSEESSPAITISLSCVMVETILSLRTLTARFINWFNSIIYYYHWHCSPKENFWRKKSVDCLLNSFSIFFSLSSHSEKSLWEYYFFTLNYFLILISLKRALQMTNNREMN
jgi:hypothetical protein